MFGLRKRSESPERNEFEKLFDDSLKILTAFGLVASFLIVMTTYNIELSLKFMEIFEVGFYFPILPHFLNCLQGSFAFLLLSLIFSSLLKYLEFESMNSDEAFRDFGSNIVKLSMICSIILFFVWLIAVFGLCFEAWGSWADTMLNSSKTYP